MCVILAINQRGASALQSFAKTEINNCRSSGIKILNECLMACNTSEIKNEQTPTSESISGSKTVLHIDSELKQFFQ